MDTSRSRNSLYREALWVRKRHGCPSSWTPCSSSGCPSGAPAWGLHRASFQGIPGHQPPPCMYIAKEEARFQLRSRGQRREEGCWVRGLGQSGPARSAVTGSLTFTCLIENRQCNSCPDFHKKSLHSWAQGPAQPPEGPHPALSATVNQPLALFMVV